MAGDEKFSNFVKLFFLDDHHCSFCEEQMPDAGRVSLFTIRSLQI